MAYVGNQAQTAFTSFDKQTITGDGTAVYTLSHSVANDQEVEVFVNNVRQEGGSGKAYTVSGNQITFSENIASTDTVYLNFAGKAVQTVVPPAGSVTDSMVTGLSSSKLSGALPAIDGSALTGMALANRNLIINGALTIDQRNAGSALTVNTASEFYAVDRFMGIGVASDGVYTLQQVTDAPDNFVNSIKATVTTADASIPTTGRYLIRHKLEGNAISQLNLGSSAAQTFTLSFYVKSSLTGTFGGSVLNGAQDRSYPFTYTISSANTWERKTVTIAGDTTGTWPTDNTKAMQISWSLGVGSDYLNTAGSWVGSQEWGATGETAAIATLNATWQITGVQLEVGTATPFEHKSYADYEWDCQRYYHMVKEGSGSYMVFTTGRAWGTGGANAPYKFPRVMRASPTMTAGGVAGDYDFALSAVPAAGSVTLNNDMMMINVSGSFTTGQIIVIGSNDGGSGAAALMFDAEL